MSSKNASNAPSSLVAFPSVSSSLHSLPHATSMHNVSLHPNMYAQRAAESEAKVRISTLSPPHPIMSFVQQLQKALSKTASQNPSQAPSYMIPVRAFSVPFLHSSSRPYALPASSALAVLFTANDATGTYISLYQFGLTLTTLPEDKIMKFA
jgi:hypothetical protein